MSNEALAGYAKYDSYKDSGVDWLGEVPEEWEVIKLKHLVNIKNGFAFPSEDYTHEGIALIRIGDLLSNGSVSLEKAPRLPNKYSKYIPEYSVKYGDMLMAMTGGTIGKVSINRTKVNSLLNQRVCNIVPSAKFHSELAWFWINSGYWKQHIEYKSFGGAQPNISDTQIKEMYIVIPHLNVQSVIAKFLYYKTDQIDQAITLKQQQIEKLNEYMQITIQNAVTKGLDANAKMKDSGIDWIDEIPENWGVKKLKYLVKIRKRIIGYEGVNVLSITQNGVKVKDITSGEGQLAMDYSKYQIVNVGDFAMNHMDLLTGYVDISKFDGVVSPDYRVFTNETDLLTSNYLINILRMGYKQKIFYKYGQGVSMLGRWRLPADNFNNFSIPIPSIAEQNEITKFIDIKIAEIDSAIELERQQIEQLKEYKTILINQAVTGKIKVS